jgi:hypothetical protein
VKHTFNLTLHGQSTILTLDEVKRLSALTTYHLNCLGESAEGLMSLSRLPKRRKKRAK